MDMDYQKVEYNANKTLDIIVPRLAEEYKLELNKPHLSITSYDYMHSSIGRFIPTGTYGVIKLQKEGCRKKRACCSTTSHEMGHAAIYQNCPSYKKYYYRSDDNDPFLTIEEGISEKFMKKGLEFLKKEGYISSSEFYSERLDNLIFNKMIKGLLFPNEYVIGEMIIDYYDKKGVSIKKLIMSPGEFEEDLKKNWKKMIKLHSKPAIKLYEKLFNHLN